MTNSRMLSVGGAPTGGRAATGGAATTGTVAAILGVHPNTLRWYETAGYLPPIPRTPGGYRQYSVEMVRLARIVRESRSLHHLGELARLLHDEHRLALEALHALERFRQGERSMEGGPPSVRPGTHSRRGPMQYIAAAAAMTSISRDRIINWERNGLGSYPRSAAGYRLFGAEELDRLMIIRSCRTAGYSITAIRRLMRAIGPCPDTACNAGNEVPVSRNVPLRTIADTPAPHETELFPLFPTDTLTATLEEMIAITERLRALFGE